MSYSFHYPASDEEFAEVANSHKRHARDIADKLQHGESLAENEAGFAAIALREWAEALPTAQRGRRGRPQKVNYSTVALLVESLVRNENISPHKAKGRAAEIFAEDFGITIDVDTIENAIKAKGSDARAFFDLVKPKKSGD